MANRFLSWRSERVFLLSGQTMLRKGELLVLFSEDLEQLYI